MKLYEIEITTRTVVQAEDDNDAWHVACKEKHDIINDLGMLDVKVLGEIRKNTPLPDGWKEDFYPYGFVHGEPERTIKQVWEAQ